MAVIESRRQFVRRGVGGLAVGTAVWAAPAVLTFSTAAAAGSPRPGGREPESAGPEVEGSSVERPNIPTAPEEKPVAGGAAGSPASHPAVLAEQATQQGAAAPGATKGAAAAAPANGRQLAFTGFDPRKLLEAGVGSVVAGGALLAAGREATD